MYAGEPSFRRYPWAPARIARMTCCSSANTVIATERVSCALATRVQQSKLAALKTQRTPEAPGENASMQATPAEEGAGLFHLANANAGPLVFTETLFVVIENSEPGSADQPVLQIQLWRVMVWHPGVDANSNKIPAKQT